MISGHPPFGIKPTLADADHRAVRRSLGHVLLLANPPAARTSCGRCGDSFTGSGSDGHAWLAAHTAEAHALVSRATVVALPLRSAPLDPPELHEAVG